MNIVAAFLKAIPQAFLRLGIPALGSSTLEKEASRGLILINVMDELQRA